MKNRKKFRGRNRLLKNLKTWLRIQIIDSAPPKNDRELEAEENVLIGQALEVLTSTRFTAIANDALAIEMYRQRCAEAFVLIRFADDIPAALRLLQDCTGQDLIEKEITRHSGLLVNQLFSKVGEKE